ncbi:uncharacterized protein BXIN_2709 [Babesia sp. Xinjiang]|uniref:uncharacterized protein n=1 Tax=Babesia sp. Xinjiang TaxID=462227 RepID=UPI000A233026|nr:uncharacterized protein BXIN_2709 [Babesia sp. Xinjiang]ORM41572.1 hypothetical protein BXIN_2709 [Babesia sp. Xinjiang]
MAASPSPAEGGTKKNSLTQSPQNLKEAIDWILRHMSRYSIGQNGGKTDDSGLRGLAEKVKDIRTNVQKEQQDAKNNLNVEAGKKLQEELQVLSSVIKDIAGNNGFIDTFSTALAGFFGYDVNNGGVLDGKGIGCKGKGDCNATAATSRRRTKQTAVEAPEKRQYTSAYDTAAKWQDIRITVDKDLCARIFVGCIPLIFSGLCYLYWQCNRGNGEAGDERWTEKALNKKQHTIDNPTTALGIYMVSMGYNSPQLNCKDGKGVASLLKTVINGNNLSIDDASVKGPYSTFIHKLMDNAKENAKQHRSTHHRFSSLYLASSTYFQALQQHLKAPVEDRALPRTIREMLYCLMGVPYTPLCNNIYARCFAEVCSQSNTVVLYFVLGRKKNITFVVSAATYYLLSSCFYSGFVLMSTEGNLHGNSTKSHLKTPLFHDIYSNEEYKFYYPDKLHEWFALLWDVAYALNLQLRFLTEQCNSCVAIGCVWKWCTYGKNVKFKVKSWLCESVVKSDDHSGVPCTAKNIKCNDSHRECVTTTKPSPLQAFLCDKLDCLKCNKTNGHDEPYTTHRSHRPRSQWCPVPMGFNEHLKLSESRTGYHLYWILEYYVADKISHASIYNDWTCLRPIPFLDHICSVFCVKFIDVYLSWVLYFADEFKRYMELLEGAFKKIDCAKAGCEKCQGGGKCGPGKHGTVDCGCVNVVHCAGVLHVYSEFGFTYDNIVALNGTLWSKETKKISHQYERKCNHFIKQLQKVIKGDPFNKFLEALTAIRNKTLIVVRYDGGAAVEGEKNPPAGDAHVALKAGSSGFASTVSSLKKSE